MANEVTIINGVTKKERNGVFRYRFGANVHIDARPATADMLIFDIDKHKNHVVAFAEITEKLGATDIEGYCDALALGGYYRTTIDGSFTIDPAGLATAANQVTGNNSLSSIDGKTPADPATVAKQNEIIAAINNISGGGGDATAANQVIGNNSLASIDGKVSTEAKQDVGNASLLSIDGKVAVEAKQDAANASLLSIDGKVATEAKQDTGNASLLSIDGKVAVEAKQDVANNLLTQIALNTLNTYQPEGLNRGISPVNAFKNVKLTSVNTIYLAYAVKLKPLELDTVIKDIRISLAPVSNITMIWYVLLNPVVAGATNYLSDSEKVDVWKGNGATNVVSDMGTVLASGVLLSGNFIDNINVVKDIALNTDTLVLALEATVNNSNVYAYLNRIED